MSVGQSSAKAVDEAPMVEPKSKWRIRASVAPVVVEDRLDRAATIVALESDEKMRGSYLIRFEGVDPKVDGLVFVATKRPRPPLGSGFEVRFALTANLEGQPLDVALALESGRWLLFPDRRNIWTDVLSNPSVDAEAMLAAHREQLANGRLEAVAPRARAGREEWQRRRFAAKTEEAASACGAPVSMDLSSAEVEWFDLFSVAGSCLDLVRDVGEFCTDYSHVREEIQRLGGLICRFEGRPSTVDMKITKGKEGLVVVPGNQHIYLASKHMLRALFEEDDQVLRHGDRYIVLKKVGKHIKVFGGSKTRLTRQRTKHRLDAAERHPNAYLWASGMSKAYLGNVKGKWTLACDEQETPLEVVFGDEREQILKSAELVDEEVWKREPYYLGRDSRGTYYYVDQLRSEDGGKAHRVFIGRRGESKLTKLVGLVEDSQGMLFSTKKGNLRLVVDKTSRESTATWIRGKKASALTSLPLVQNQKLIYQSLGAYFGESFGDLCEF